MTRSEAYKHILAMGLLALRDRAPRFNSPRLIEIEAEHLHNIPSLIDEDNLQRHFYYFDKDQILSHKLKNRESILSFEYSI